MIKLFIDTNVLIHSSEWKVSIKEQITKFITVNYEIFIHQLVLEELFEATEARGKTKKLAKLAIQLSNQYHLYEDEREYAGTDIALLKTTKRENGILITFDRKLLHRCKDAGVPVLYIKGKGKLTLIGHPRAYDI